MELNTIETIQAAEEEFDLVVSDEDADTLVTVGDVHALVLAALRGQGDSPDEAQVWERLRGAIVRLLGSKPAEIVADARIDDLSRS